MTAHAATILAALHVSDRIKDYGSYAGFACVLGLAVLALLYFAQAREVKRLREWAGRAPERDAELQARVTAEAQQRAATPAAVPTAAAAATAAKPAAVAATPAGQAAAKPAVAAAASAPATATPGQQPAAKPGEPAKPGVPAPATAAAAAAGAASASPATAKPDAPKPQDGATAGDGATPRPTTPKPATPAGASPSNGAVDQPTQITPAPAAGAAAAAAAAAKPTPRPGQPLRPPPAVPVAQDEPDHSPLRATLMIVGGVVGVVAVALVLVFVVFSGNDNKKAPNTIGNAPATTPSSSSKTGSKSSATKTAPVSRGDVKVAVLNGTTVPGLARGAATKLQNAGFQIGTVTNAPDQARSATIVAYQPGHQNEARVVARLIQVGTDAVRPIDQSTAVVAGQDAFVVVTVGADQSQ